VRHHAQHDVLRWLPRFESYRHAPIADRLDLERPSANAAPDERGAEETEAIKRDAARLFEVPIRRKPADNVQRTTAGHRAADDAARLLGSSRPSLHHAAAPRFMPRWLRLERRAAPNRAVCAPARQHSSERLLLRRQGSHDRLASKLRAEAAELRNANAELHTKLVSAIAKTIQLKVEVRRSCACVCA